MLLDTLYNELKVKTPQNQLILRGFCTQSRKPIHIKRLVKVLGVNQRTIILLDNKEFLDRYFPWEYRVFNLVEVEKFIKSLPD